MNYIYNIYLNLNKTLYDFFDWSKNDKIIHIKKIPIFKINVDNFKNIVNYTIKVDEEFLNYVHNQTETWNSSKNIEFCALFCDKNNIIAVEFDNNGNSIKKSFLMIEEELEILEDIINIHERNIEFKIIDKTNSLLKTRKQIKEQIFINKELKNIDTNKLNYIYFECFNKLEKNYKIKINKLKNLSINSLEYKKLYDILKLTSITKNKML